MRTVLMIGLPFGLLLTFGAFLELNRHYYQVDPEIYEAYQSKDLKGLKSMIHSPEKNPWQQRNAIMYAAKLDCEPGLGFVQKALKAEKIESRTGLFEGCFTHPWKEVQWIVPYALNDPTLSYNRLLGLEYVESNGRLHLYRDWIVNAAESDGSKMIQNAARDVLQRYGPKLSQPSIRSQSM